MSERQPVNVLDAAAAIASAVEANAVALMDAATAIRHVAEHVRDLRADDNDPFKGATRQ